MIARRPITPATIPMIKARLLFLVEMIAGGGFTLVGDVLGCVSEGVVTG